MVLEISSAICPVIARVFYSRMHAAALGSLSRGKSAVWHRMENRFMIETIRFDRGELLVLPSNLFAQRRSEHHVKTSRTSTHAHLAGFPSPPQERCLRGRRADHGRTKIVGRNGFARYSSAPHLKRQQLQAHGSIRRDASPRCSCTFHLHAQQEMCL